MEEEEEEDDEDVSISARLHAGMVPDATMIHSIKKKRELARNLGVDSVDYLPLEKGGKKYVIQFMTCLCDMYCCQGLRQSNW